MPWPVASHNRNMKLISSACWGLYLLRSWLLHMSDSVFLSCLWSRKLGKLLFRPQWDKTEGNFRCNLIHCQFHKCCTVTFCLKALENMDQQTKNIKPQNQFCNTVHFHSSIIEMSSLKISQRRRLNGKQNSFTCYFLEYKCRTALY